jgi:cytochrome P450
VVHIAGCRVASRDPKQFEEPNHLNLKLLNNQHLAFGADLHFCVGSQFVRLEDQFAISKMLQRFPHIKLAGPRPERASTFGFSVSKVLP